MASKSSLYPSKSTPLSKSASTSSTNSSSLAFTASLSSLLATSASASSPQTRPARPSKNPSTQPRDSIFTTHVRNKKRPLHEPSSSSEGHAPPQKHAKTSESIDAATLARSRRKMEEKARLYASMKRGDYVPPTDGRGRDKEAEGLIDFDRKWAESADGDKDNDNDNTSSDAYSDSDPEETAGPGQAVVEYTDEFGRTLTGTARDAARSQRRQHAAAYATSSLASASAHPPPPSTLIYGDTVQAAAFNPSATLTAQMAGLAAKRDRSATPPEEVHYDASSEVRAKGVGFFQFSRDKEGRGREMEGLERERGETERARQEREREGRRRRVEERRRIVGEKREERRVERFLEGLDVP